MLSLNCKHVQNVKISLPCNFEVNSITYFGVITLFSSYFKIAGYADLHMLNMFAV
jgi:hypothetical protein